MQTHSLLLTSYENCEPANTVGIIGQCSCSAWFELRVDASTCDLLFLVRQNNFPPCPAVGPLVDHFEEELELAHYG